jgi:hypothetical protein
MWFLLDRPNASLDAWASALLLLAACTRWRCKPPPVYPRASPIHDARWLMLADFSHC